MGTARLVLASTSPYRRELLERLRVPFTVHSPDVDESPLPGEEPAATALRLAISKARAGVGAHPRSLVIGSDQVAEVAGVRLLKPGTHARATEQLALLSGRNATFHTAIALLNGQTGTTHTRVVPTRVRFRVLSAKKIESYLAREQPYDCLGSAKSEGLGIALLEAVDTTDPTALVGLPLIALTDLLEAEGVRIL
jgi:septum formation protein